VILFILSDITSILFNCEMFRANEVAPSLNHPDRSGSLNSKYNPVTNNGLSVDLKHQGSMYILNQFLFFNYIRDLLYDRKKLVAGEGSIEISWRENQKSEGTCKGSGAYDIVVNGNEDECHRVTYEKLIVIAHQFPKLAYL
jgi:hypothetical protein